jgi:hypothetical protein
MIQKDDNVLREHVKVIRSKIGAKLVEQCRDDQKEPI